MMLCNWKKLDKMGQDLGFSPFFFDSDSFRKNGLFRAKCIHMCKWESGPLTSFLSLSLFSIMFQYINSNEMSCQLTDGHWILISWWFHQSVNVWSRMMNQSILHFFILSIRKTLDRSSVHFTNLQNSAIVIAIWGRSKHVVLEFSPFNASNFDKTSWKHWTWY